MAERLGAGEFLGVATAAFRQAANGPDAVRRLSEAAALKLDIVSQRDEAILGYHAAHAGGETLPESSVVWDIGGGSQQIVARSAGRFVVYEGALASESFRRAVVEGIQRKPGSRSPNPMTDREVAAAWAMARAAALAVPAEVRAELGKPGVRVTGIGGVHVHSVRGQTRSESFTLSLIRTAIARLHTAPDRVIGGPFAASQVTNLILVGAYMDSLGISRVESRDVNLTDGLLVHPECGRRAPGTQQ